MARILVVNVFICIISVILYCDYGTSWNITDIKISEPKVINIPREQSEVRYLALNNETDHPKRRRRSLRKCESKLAPDYGVLFECQGNLHHDVAIRYLHTVLPLPHKTLLTTDPWQVPPPNCADNNIVPVKLKRAVMTMRDPEAEKGDLQQALLDLIEVQQKLGMTPRDTPVVVCASFYHAHTRYRLYATEKRDKITARYKELLGRLPPAIPDPAKAPQSPFPPLSKMGTPASAPEKDSATTRLRDFTTFVPEEPRNTEKRATTDDSPDQEGYQEFLERKRKEARTRHNQAKQRRFLKKTHSKRKDRNRRSTHQKAWRLHPPNANIPKPWLETTNIWLNEYLKDVKSRDERERYQREYMLWLEKEARRIPKEWTGVLDVFDPDEMEQIGRLVRGETDDVSITIYEDGRCIDPDFKQYCNWQQFLTAEQAMMDVREHGSDFDLDELASLDRETLDLIQGKRYKEDQVNMAAILSLEKMIMYGVKHGKAKGFDSRSAGWQQTKCPAPIRQECVRPEIQFRKD